MKIVTIEDIKTDIDLQIYGWELRLLQIEEDIYLLNKRKEEFVTILDGLKEERGGRNDTNKFKKLLSRTTGRNRDRFKVVKT